MHIVAAVIILLLIAIYYWRRSEDKRGKYVYGLAKTNEDKRNYEAACFHYAVAANAGYQSRLCHQKVKDLWNTYGPFEFLEQLKELKEEYCRDQSCGEGYFHITVQDIHKIVGLNKDTGAT